MNNTFLTDSYIAMATDTITALFQSQLSKIPSP